MEPIPAVLKELSEEELEKVKPLTKEEIEEALEKGRKDKELFEKYQVPCMIDSGIWFV